MHVFDVLLKKKTVQLSIAGNSYDIYIYYIDTSVLLENKPGSEGSKCKRTYFNHSKPANCPACHFF